MELEVGQKIEVVIGRFTNIGIRVLVEEEYEGMLYKNEVFQRVREGQRLDAYVKKIREDGLIDVSLQPVGFLNKIGENEAVILNKLKSLDGGFIGYNDKSSPEDIKYHFKMSKKSFKSAIGGLYKAKQIEILENGIQLVSETK